MDAMGLMASVFGAGSDQEAAAALGSSDGFPCDVGPTELWELEGILTSSPALGLPSAQYQPVGATEGYECFVIPIGAGLGASLDAAGEVGRASAAQRWRENSVELENWTQEQVQFLVESLHATLASIALSGDAPYLSVCI
ncbi:MULTISPECIES: hypothetical protein [unclassified Rathayibacter]|uniref:hypothetical protein n=1 Tax=unclassified Rathayibacter TaxID=2609250 RepID=UPI0011AFE30C|nr:MULTISPECIES: hypothetical protein [unclassified Rathayibacter]